MLRLRGVGECVQCAGTESDVVCTGEVVECVHCVGTEREVVERGELVHVYSVLVRKVIVV